MHDRYISELHFWFLLPCQFFKKYQFIEDGFNLRQKDLSMYNNVLSKFEMKFLATEIYLL